MTKRTFGQLGAVLLLALTVGQDAEAQRRGGRWEYLGEANVDGGADHDMIRVGRSEGSFRAIQLRVEGGTIDFHRVIVHYGRGDRETVAYRERIPPGGTSRVIDLPGMRRTISGVELFYSRGRWGSRRPKVRLFGMK